MAIEVIYSARIEEPDRRQRMWVTLQRTDQPVTYKYYCMKCGTPFPFTELVNYEPLVVTDMIDTTNVNQGAVGVRCPGKYFDQDQHRLVNCRVWYYWSMGQQ